MPNFFRCSICREPVVEWGQIAGCARCLAARQPEPQPGFLATQFERTIAILDAERIIREHAQRSQP